eukprot:scaffold5_cov331-Pavlova_lutheri.AAC.10
MRLGIGWIVLHSLVLLRGLSYSFAWMKMAMPGQPPNKIPGMDEPDLSPPPKLTSELTKPKGRAGVEGT